MIAAEDWRELGMMPDTGAENGRIGAAAVAQNDRPKVQNVEDQHAWEIGTEVEPGPCD